VEQQSALFDDFFSAEGPQFHMSAEQIAQQLARSAGACTCYLVYVGEPGQRPGLTSSSATITQQEITMLLPLLQQARDKTQPYDAAFDGKPALLLPLHADGRRAGIALLTFADGAAIAYEQAYAAAELASSALGAARTIATLHMQAGEIEERVRLREVQTSRNLIRGVIDSIPLGLALVASDGSILAANRALSERFGRDPSKLVGMFYDSVIGRWELAPAARTFASGRTNHDRRSMVRPDGSTALLEISSFPLQDEDGNTHQAVEVWEDITQRVALQTQLVRAEKLAAIGQLAASIAHEVGNPLQAIQGFLSLFLEQCDPETPNRRFLELAEEEIERIVQVISRLRDLYRPKTDVIAPVDVNDLIEQVLLLTSKQLERADIRISHELDPALPHIQGVPHHLKQVFLNLVLNAIEAMPNGGTLHVQTVKPHKSNDRVVMVRVSDSGVGIPRERIPHLFDGLHTSKEHGMGLGWYTSKSIIDQHMGRVDVESAVGHGTTFMITLPIDYQEDLQ
jgi:PAS domain S-box-containing protein